MSEWMNLAQMKWMQSHDIAWNVWMNERSNVRIDWWTDGWMYKWTSAGINTHMKTYVQQRQHETTKHKQWTTTASKQNMECSTETRIGRNTNTTNNDKEAPTQKILNRNTYSNNIDYENNKLNETRQTH